MIVPGLNEIIHQPVRLRIMASLSALGPGERLDFTYLRTLLGVTDGNLGAHLQKLEEARYIKLTKTFVNRKPRTHIGLTAKGRAAFTAHVAALQGLLEGVESQQ
jgi:DNA-binding MarR family transcriptional regulator